MLNKEYLTIKKIKESDEVYISNYAVKPLIKYLKKFEKELNHSITIWCPFDLENSSLIKEFSNAGFKVIYFSIDDNKDFFPYEPKILLFM